MSIARSSQISDDNYCIKSYPEAQRTYKQENGEPVAKVIIEI